jgi:hypothetical protein
MTPIYIRTFNAEKEHFVRYGGLMAATIKSPVFLHVMFASVTEVGGSSMLTLMSTQI